MSFIYQTDDNCKQKIKFRFKFKDLIKLIKYITIINKNSTNSVRFNYSIKPIQCRKKKVLINYFKSRKQLRKSFDLIRSFE